MSMKSIFSITFLVCVLTVNIFPQQVTVSQSFVDDATKSFIEVRALRELEAARKSEIAAKDDQIRLQTQLIESLKIQNNLLLQQNTDLSKLKANTFSLFFGLVKFKRFK